MPQNVFPLDSAKPCTEQRILGHNRWHPDIPPAEYLTTFGWSAEQAYLLLGAAPIEGWFSGVVDIPNACATVYLPLDIFDIDIRPGSGEVPRIDPGIGAPRASVG